MSETKFTAGPWRPKSMGVYAASREAGKKEQCICQFSWMMQARLAEKNANAALIAAAPEMFVLLRDILEAATTYGRTSPEWLLERLRPAQSIIDRIERA